MRYTPFFILCFGCAPEWVDVQDAAVDTKEETSQVENNVEDENNSSENNEDENSEDENSEDENSEDENSEDENSEDENSEGNTGQENTEEDPGSDNTEDPPEDTSEYVGSYIGSFSGAYDYGYGYVDEFCNGTLELNLTSNYDVTGGTICQTLQGSWTYSFEGEASEDGNDVNISGTMTATDQFGTSFPTDLYGFISLENNGSYMSLEWEFPDYGIIGNADLELQ